MSLPWRECGPDVRKEEAEVPGDVFMVDGDGDRRYFLEGEEADQVPADFHVPREGELCSIDVARLYEARRIGDVEGITLRRYAAVEDRAFDPLADEFFGIIGEERKKLSRFFEAIDR